ncbi:MAG: nuclear transport factor 2 family protein [Gemmatimonadota bacterium]
MRWSTLPVVATLTLFLAAPLVAQEEAGQAEGAAGDHAGPDFTAMYADYTAAFNAGDMDGVLSHYAEEATAMFQGGPAMAGHAEMRPRFEEFFAAGAQIALHPGEQKVMGHMAVDQGHYVITMEVEGESVNLSGYYMGLMHEHDDGWKFVRIVSNSDQER